MIPTPSEYFIMLADNLKKIIKMIPKIQIATVYEIAVDGEPILIFPAEKYPSMMADRKRNRAYIPEIGDTVMLINNVIMGGWQ